MSTLSTLMTGTVVAIQALPSVAGFPVSSMWLPEFDRATIAKGIYVSPEDRTTTLISRACKERSATLLVACVDRLAQGTEDAQTLACDTLAESIGDGLLGQRIGSLLCHKADSAIKTAFSVESMREDRLALFFVRLHFKG